MTLVFEVGRKRGESAKGPVHVKPQIFLLAKIGQPIEIVASPGVDGTGVSDHAERVTTRVPIRFDRRRERIDVHRVIITHRDSPKGFAAQAQDLHRFHHRRVSLFRGIERHSPRNTLDTFLSNVELRLGMTGDGEPHQVRHRAAVDEQAAGVGWVAEHLLHPVDHLPLHESRRLIEASAIRIHAGRQ